MSNSIYFLVYPSFKIVQGKSHTAIIDVQNNAFYSLDNGYSEIILNCMNRTEEEIKSHYGENYSLVRSIIEKLVEDNIGFFTDEPERFPQISEDFNLPGTITNCLIDIKNEASLSALEQAIPQLEGLLCKYLEIRVWGTINNQRLLNVLVDLDERGSYIQGVSLVIPLSVYEYLKSFRSLRLKNITVYNSDHNEVTFDKEKYVTVQHTTKMLRSELCCGKISKQRFSPNLFHYNESKQFNSCLNRKISIDGEGEIKNCPSMFESFGNIRDTTLEAALEMKGFKKHWNINKDKILVCKDCEYRYICTDCRAYLEDPEDLLSKPLKCGYDPYKGEWSEWSTNPLKQKAIGFYGIGESVKINA